MAWYIYIIFARVGSEYIQTSTNQTNLANDLLQQSRVILNTLRKIKTISKLNQTSRMSNFLALLGFIGPTKIS